MELVDDHTQTSPRVSTGGHGSDEYTDYAAGGERRGPRGPCSGGTMMTSSSSQQIRSWRRSDALDCTTTQVQTLALDQLTGDTIDEGKEKRLQ
jgi:hypothetical protein